MYFDTIHDLAHFDGVNEPEDGYSSYWETDTEVESELGNFIFSNITGDSASVICVDEAVDLLELRERERQMIAGAKQLEAQCLESSKEEHVLERSTDSKRSSASRHSRQSHHSGSDGTYDGPPPPPVPPRRPSSVADHIYETLDDCKEQYQTHNMDLIYISKASEGSRASDDSTTKPATNDEDSDRSSGKAPKIPPNRHYTKHRNSSSPQFQNVVPRHRRKLSDGSNLINTLQKSAKRSSEIIPTKSSSPGPIKAYPFPPGVPEQYVDYMATPVAPPVPERRKTTRSQRPPSLIIKHKGQTFVVPVVDKKLQQRLEKVKGPPQITTVMQAPRLRDSALYSTLPRHATLHTTISRSSSGSGGAPGSGIYQTLVHSHSLRAHASPPKFETSELTVSHKRKGSKHGPHTSKQVTHYGVI